MGNQKDILEKKDHYILLFDFYEELLTLKQQEYFKAYYFDDLSLSEVASMYNVSRNAIFDGLSKICNILDDYESKLNLLDKFKKRNDIYEILSKKNEDIKKIVERLKEID